MKYKIIPATNGPKHHLFGFHDLVAFNQTGEKLLSLEADVINRLHYPVNSLVWDMYYGRNKNLSDLVKHVH